MTRQPGPPPPSPPYSGPNYQGFVFVLPSSSGAPTHILAISTQQNENIAEMAYITGLWYPSENPTNQNSVIGQIGGNGGVISCVWGLTSNGYHELLGTLTYNAGGVGKFGQGLGWPSAYLDGDVAVYVGGNPQSGGPGHVSGWGRRPILTAP